MLKKLIYILIFITFIYSCPEGYVNSSNTSQEECIPELFFYNSSTQQAAYFFSNVYLDGVLLDSNDWVGAFNGDICVGSRKWDVNECNGICDVPVLGQDSQLTQGYMSNGVTPTFKIFKSSSSSYIDAYASIDYPWSNFSTPIIDALYGCEQNNCTQHFVDSNINLYSGWNWISLNVIDNDMSLNSILSTINPNAQFIKNQEYYSEYYSGFGWFGSLDELDNTSMYKLRMSNNDEINISAFSVDVESTIFDLSTGWNWIGYAPQNSIDINTALSNIPNSTAEFIKSQYYYSEFNEDLGWFGTLEQMDPHLGYLLKVNEDISFKFIQDSITRSISENDIDNNNFNINVHDFEFNGTITSAIYIDNDRINTYDYTLLAFDENNVLVGATEPLYFPVDGELIFPLMIYSNNNGIELYFKAYNKKENIYLDINQKLIFNNDMILGSAINPIKMLVLNSIDNYSLNNPYPNPFNPIVNFDLDLKLDSYVDIIIYDLQGKEVEKIHSGYLTSKLYNFNWNASKYSTGIYLVNILIDKNLYSTNKVILLK